MTLSNATGGSFRLAFMGQTTAAIAYNASAATVESALETLQAVDQVTVTGNAGGPWTITFAGTHADTNVQQIQGDAAAAESGTVARTLSFEYDAANQMTEASDPAATYNYTYDYLGRVTSETQDLANFTPNIVLDYTWDVNNNRLSMAAEIGGTDDFKNEYTYDYLNRMTRVTQQGQTGGNAVATKRVDFAYNGLGQFTTIDRYQNTAGNNIVAQTTFAYDDDSRLTDLDHKQSSTTLAGYDYGYDNMGRITSIVSSVEGTSTFTYDKTSQLTGADHASPRADESYTYDDNGNRTMSGYTVTANNLTTSDGTYDYEYDDEGNRTKRTNISTGDYEVYEWDHRNRLVSVTFCDSMDTELKSVDHTYDIFNRWLRRTTDPDGPGGSSAVDTFFAYDGIEPILQFDGASASDLTNRYLFGPAVDQILASEDVTSLSSAGNIIWALSDHLGTPRDLADQNESTYTTTVTNHRTYGSFGTRTAETNAVVDLLFGFTGKALDDDTGLGNHWNRWLAFAQGQWISEDPIGFRGHDQNVRRYVKNRVNEHVDPTGLRPPFSQFPEIDDLLNNPPPIDLPRVTFPGVDVETQVDTNGASGRVRIEGPNGSLVNGTFAPGVANGFFFVPGPNNQWVWGTFGANGINGSYFVPLPGGGYASGSFGPNGSLGSVYVPGSGGSMIGGQFGMGSPSGSVVINGPNGGFGATFGPQGCSGGFVTPGPAGPVIGTFGPNGLGVVMQGPQGGTLGVGSGPVVSISMPGPYGGGIAGTIGAGPPNIIGVVPGPQGQLGIGGVASGTAFGGGYIPGVGLGGAAYDPGPHGGLWGGVLIVPADSNWVIGFGRSPDSWGAGCVITW